MKITKLVLKNFASIKNAMNSNEISIDFNQCKNTICLLIGENGSGKTSILSQLQPFANLGNLDLRNDQPLILDGKEGYKEIHIKKEKDYYVIKHYYTPKKEGNHSVKSYISKNDTELNNNGNVTSFKEYVKEELKIESDYLKLIRLGSNVKSLIGLTETERKSFMSNILDEIGVYLTYYKSVGDKLKYIKEMISHTVNKIDKLGITEKVIFISLIENLESEIESESKYEEELKENMSILKYEISKIDDKESLRDNLSKYERKLSKMETVIANKSSIKNLDVSFYEKEIKKKEDKLNKNKTSIEAMNLTIVNTTNLLDSYRTQYHNLKVQYDKELESDKELSKMKDSLKELRLKIRKSEKIISQYEPVYSLQELESFIVFIKNIQLELNKTYDFGKKPIKKVVELIRENKNFSNFINSHLIDIDEKHSEYTTLILSRLFKIASFNNKDSNNVIINCKTECQAKILYNELKSIYEGHDVKEKSKDATFYKDMEYAYNNINHVLKELSEWTAFISLIPDKDIVESLSINMVLYHIERLESIYDESKINDLLLMAKEYDNCVQYKKQYNIDEENISKFSSIGNLSYIEGQLKSVSDQIAENEEYIKTTKEQISLLREENDELSNDIEQYSLIFETLTSYDEITELYKKTKEDYDKYKENNDKIQDVSIKLHTTSTKILEKRKELEEMKIKLSQYENLHKELRKYNKIFEEMTLVRSALSSKEGIPLHYIFNYLGDTVSITNELLDNVYNGESYIDKFEISPTSFSIPFYSKGYLLPDVKYASQGELAFLTIALSFALSSKSLSDYNIMLLDEADAALDVKKREMFIKIIEAMKEKVHSEQTFAITHNEMFSFYPIDIIDLSFSDRKDEYPLANFIEVERK